MIDVLLVALGRLPPCVRRLAVAVGAVLAVGAAIAAVMLSGPRDGPGRQPAVPRRHVAGGARTSLPRIPPPVSAGQLFVARGVGERFLAGYLPFAYGRGSVSAVSPVTPGLRHQLTGEWARLTPAERRRRPRVISLQTVGTTPALVVATAVVDDGGVTTYRLRFTLEGGSGRWAVSSVEAG